jgi:UDPglucose 6-dehydrogenase
VELDRRGLDYEFNVVSNPEFLKEGAAVDDFMKPDRIVVGTESPQAESVMREIYAPFNRNHDRMVIMDSRSAELTKYAANAMLATKISFMNEMANLAERLGADIEQVRRGIGSDPRIGYHFIYPGCGYGGSCFPKDVQALAKTAAEVGYESELLKAVGNVNQRQKKRLFELLDEHFKGDLKGRVFALWGGAFKPNTDDMREAPSRTLMEQLWAAGARVQAYDPEAMQEMARIYGDRDDLLLAESKEAALEQADALIICTEWQAFRALDHERVREALKAPLIFDGRNLYDPKSLKEAGFVYYGIGRGQSINHLKSQVL